MTAKVALRSLLIVGLVPLVGLGLLVSLAKVYGLVRHDPAYFTGAYRAQYATPAVVAKALETALQTGDLSLMAELQGLRWPTTFDTSPAMTWVQLWERTDRYITYLYYDVSTNEPYPYHMEEVKGRWVVSPSDLYHFVESGAYKSRFLTFSLLWWASSIVTVVLVHVLSTSERFGARP